ncbi:MAG: ammonium transporter [Euryarchaeota archaeon]|nr:ammonium transporter [Euryarchaeota archaeon]
MPNHGGGVFSGQGYADGMTMGSQIGVQVMGIVATAVYTAVLTYIILKIVNGITGMRVSEEEESTGLDIVLHDERGYDL